MDGGPRRSARSGDPRASGEPHAAGEPHAVGEPQAAVEKLTDAVRAMPFRTRAEAMLDVLVTALDDGETLLRNLRTDPALAPTALSVLVRRDLLAPEDLTEAEALLMVAESLLQLLETAGPDGVSEMLRDQGSQAEEAFEAGLASGHPDRVGIAELKTVAEYALRKPSARVGRVVRQRSHGKNKGRGLARGAGGAGDRPSEPPLAAGRGGR